MSLIAFATAALIFQAPPPAAPDRSGEPALRKVFSWAKGLNNVHVVVLKKTRDSISTPMYPDIRIDLWLSGPKFRLETSGYWGDGSLVVSDGVTAMSDSNDESQPAVIADAKGSALATLADLKVSADDLSPLFALMSGPDQVDKLIEKTSAIKEDGNKSGEHMIEFSCKKLGNVKLQYHDDREGSVLDRIEFDNLLWLQEQHEKFPDWYDEPDPGTMTRNDVVILTEKIKDSLFDPKPAKGRAFEDRRKKSGKAG